MEDYEYLERQLDETKRGGSAEPGTTHQDNGDAAASEIEPSERRSSKSRDRDKERRRSRSRERRRRSKDRSKDRSRDRSRDRSSRGGDRDKRRSRSRDRDRKRDREDRSRDRDRDRGGERDRHDAREFGRGYGRQPPPSFRRRDRTPPEERLAREKERELKEMDRATRTIFASNLNLKAEEEDIWRFFSKAGTVNDIQIITDKNTKKSKGMAYIEYKTQEELFVAISTMNGQIFMNMPVMLRTSEVEKNLAWEAQQAAKQQQNNADAASLLLTSMGGVGVPAGLGSCRLQVNNLHPGLEDVDLRDAFQTFGFLELIQVAKDPATNQSLGYGFVQFRRFSDGVHAMQHWNGKQLGGRTLEVRMAPLPDAVPNILQPNLLPPDVLGLVPGGVAGMAQMGGMPGLGAPAAAPAANPYAALVAQQQLLAAQAQAAPQINELDEMDEEGGKGGLRLDAQKRAALMQRLAATAGMDTKPAAVPGMMQVPQAPAAPAVAQTVMLEQGLLGPASPIPTPAILLKNMFDPAEEAARGEPDWVTEVEGDVKDECARFGEVQHLFVDKNSKGFVYVKFAQQQGAEAAHRALNLRWYSGKQILVEYQFVAVYNTVFGLR